MMFKKVGRLEPLTGGADGRLFIEQFSPTSDFHNGKIVLAGCDIKNAYRLNQESGKKLSKLAGNGGRGKAVGKPEELARFQPSGSAFSCITLRGFCCKGGYQWGQLSTGSRVQSTRWGTT